jgi:trk system potassium uptake protein
MISAMLLILLISIPVDRYFLTLKKSYTEDADMSLILFETISAFGTVGLTAGLTYDLSPVGRLLITLMMFIGRLGPLTMAFALLNTRKEAKVRYAEEKILIG